MEVRGEIGCAARDMTDTPPASDRISTGIAGLDELLRGGLHGQSHVSGRRVAGYRQDDPRHAVPARGTRPRRRYVVRHAVGNDRSCKASRDSHGWSLDGIEIFQLASRRGASPEEQYTLYHPAEVELGETIKARARRRSSGAAARASSSTRSRRCKLLARDPLRYRRQILALKEFFAGPRLTVLLLDDLRSGGGDLQLQSLAHGVILLEQLPFEYGRARRRIRIVKFRGVAAIEGFHDFAIRRGGIAVFPQLTTDRRRTACRREPLSSGLPSWISCSAAGCRGARRPSSSAQRAPANPRSPRNTSTPRRRGQRGRLSLRRAARQLRGAVRRHRDEDDGAASRRARDAWTRSSRARCRRVSSAIASATPSRRGAQLVFIDSVNGYLNAIPQVEAPLVPSARAAVVSQRERRHHDPGRGAARRRRGARCPRRSTSVISPTR